MARGADTDHQAVQIKEPAPTPERPKGMRRLVACTTLGLTLLVSACSPGTGAPERAASDAGSSASIVDGRSSQDTEAPSDRVERVDAVWRLPEDEYLEPSTQSFTVEVSRVPCNSGVTGEVLAPTVEEGKRRVVVTFSVAPDDTLGNEDCQGNDWVTHTVRLLEALGERSLFDGECLPEATATAPGLCRPGGLRYPLARPR